MRQNILGYIDLYIPSNKDIFTIWGILNNSGLFESVEINAQGKINGYQCLPNDQGFPYQYYLNQSNNIDIDAPEAWCLVNGSENIVIVADIDGGINFDHVDLNMWEGKGWDFIDNDNLPFGGSDYPGRHGTAVAGVYGARTNNYYGISGVAGGWVRVFGVKNHVNQNRF